MPRAFQTTYSSASVSAETAFTLAVPLDRHAGTRAWGHRPWCKGLPWRLVPQQRRPPAPTRRRTSRLVRLCRRRLHLPARYGRDAEKPELTKQFNEGYKTDLAEPGAKTRSARSNFGPHSGVACPLGSAAPTPEATPAPLETSSPSATPKSAPALQTWAASNAGSVVNGRLTTPPGQGYVKSQRGHYQGSSDLRQTKQVDLLLPPPPPPGGARHSAAASRRQ